MRQNPRVEPPTQPAIMLHSVLSKALANLDIQLEDELARYRRQRLSGGRATRQLERRRSSEPLDLMAVSATPKERSTAAIEPAPVLEERLAEITQPSIAPDGYKPIPAFTANPQPFEGAIALRANPPTYNGSAHSPLSGGNDAHALAQAATPNLDDYLESSEELLRSLADEQAEVQAERHFMQSLLTPLGLGSMLLLLLSSAMFGYVIMNPSSLGSWAKLSQPPASPGQPQGSGATPSPLPLNPASRALPDLNPNNLGVLDPNRSSRSSLTQPTVTPTSKPTITAPNAPTTAPLGQSRSDAPSASPQPAMPAATSDSSRPSTATRTAEPYQPAPRRVAPAQAPVATVRPAPAVNTPAPSGNGAGSGSYQYKVGIPFENDQTLENARKVVPDAFVRTLPDGRTIVQVGAAHDEAEGKANVQKLRDQGLSSTEVYKR